MATPLWSDVEKDPDFISLSDEEKKATKQRYYDNVISKDTDFQSLPDEEKTNVQARFFGEPAQASDPNEPTGIRGVVKSVANASSLPMRGLRGAAVAGETLLTGDQGDLTSLEGIKQRGQEAILAGERATKPEYVPQEGEKLGAFAGEMADPRFMGASALATPLKIGKYAKAAVEGAAFGGGAAIIKDLEEKGAVEKGDIPEIAGMSAVGAVAGPALIYGAEKAIAGVQSIWQNASKLFGRSPAAISKATAAQAEKDSVQAAKTMREAIDSDVEAELRNKVAKVSTEGSVPSVSAPSPTAQKLPIVETTAQTKTEKPFALFIGNQDYGNGNVTPLYTVYGNHPRRTSTFPLKDIEAMGLPITGREKRVPAWVVPGDATSETAMARKSFLQRESRGRLLSPEEQAELGKLSLAGELSSAGDAPKIALPAGNKVEGEGFVMQGGTRTPYENPNPATTEIFDKKLLKDVRKGKLTSDFPEPVPTPEPPPPLSTKPVTGKYGTPQPLVPPLEKPSAFASLPGYTEAAQTLKSVNPFIDSDTFLGFLSERVAKRAPGKDMGQIAESLVEKLANRDRSFSNIAKTLSETVIGKDRMGTLTKIAAGRDLSQMMSRAIDLHGDDILGRPLQNASDRIEAMMKLSAGLKTKKDRLYRGFLKEAVEDLPKGIGDGWGQVPPEVAFASKNFKEISQAEAVLTDPERLGMAVDPSGAFNQFVLRDVWESELKSFEKARDLMKTFQTKFPEFEAGSKQSAILQRLGEGRITGEDFKYVTPRMREALKEIKDVYTSRLNAVNDVRVQAGKAPIPFRKDYMTHFKEMSALEELFGPVQAPTKEMLQAMDFGKASSPFFRSAMERLGGVYTDDAVTGLEKYIRGSTRIEELTPAIKRLRATSSIMPPVAGKAFADLATETISNKNVLGALDELTNTKAFKLLAMTQSRILRNLISGNLNTVLVQTGSIPYITSQTGTKNFALGAIDAMNPTKRAFANAASQVLRAGDKGTELTPSLAKKALGVLDIPLQFMNQQISTTAFLAGLRKAQDKGLIGKEAITFADRVANRANVLYLRSNTPRILRSKMVSTLVPLQRFTLNAYNFLKHDIAQQRGVAANLSDKEMYKRAANFAVSALTLDAIYQAAGLRLPISPEDMIPFKSAFRGGGAGGLGPITQTAGELVSGSFDLAKGDFESGTNKFKNAAYKLALPAGGMQLKRIIEKGQLLPDSK